MQLKNGLTLVNSTDPLPEKNVIVVIYGQPGVGKTSLSYTADNPLGLDYDDGLERACFRKTAIKLKNVYNDKGKLTATGYEILKGYILDGSFNQLITENKINTAIIDTGGTMLDDHMALYLMNKTPKYRRGDGSLTIQGYGALKNEYKWFVRELKQRNLDIVIICHATEKEDRLRPKMTGGSLDSLKETADLLGYMSIIGNDRILDFNPTEKAYGKNVADFEPLKIPLVTDEKYPNFIGNLIKLTKKKMTTLSSSQTEALELLNTVREKISEASTVEELEEILPEINELEVTLATQVLKSYTIKYFELYVTENWEPLDNVKGFNQAMKNVPIHIEERYRKHYGIKLLDFAKAKGYIWNKKDATFTKAEKKKVTKTKADAESEKK